VDASQLRSFGFIGKRTAGVEMVPRLLTTRSGRRDGDVSGGLVAI
jgi:hypothetical protein